MTQQVEWPPGTRLRCIDGGSGMLNIGAEYLVYDASDYFVHVAYASGYAGPFYRDRFKPVVRVKMGRLDTNEMLAQREADFAFFRTGER